MLKVWHRLTGCPFKVLIASVNLCSLPHVYFLSSCCVGYPYLEALLDRLLVTGLVN